nr:BBP7 family outer membrane beta-barrel protein [Neorhodopirellula pilleata]
MSNLLTKRFRITLGAIIALAVITVSPNVQAQTNRQDRPNSGDLENAARASWQPVRDLSQTTIKRRPQSTQVRLVDHQEPTLAQPASTRTTVERPTPTKTASVRPMPSARKPVSARPASASIISHPVVQESVPLDGEIYFDPIHDGGCDAMPMGCGCGVGGCHGTCGISMGGCDGIGCSTGNCCNGDPMCGEYRDCDTLRPCVTICWPQDGWFSAEYLMWWQDGMDLPPLASTGRLSDRAPLANGTVLYGDDEVLDGRMDGYRFDFGFWFDNCHTWGIGAGFFGLDRETEGFSGGNDNSTLVRPIITVLPNLADPTALGDLEEAVALVNDPTRDHNGSLNIDVNSELSGWDLYVRHFTRGQSGCACTGPCGCPTAWCTRSEHRFGFRQVELDEGIAINSSVLIDQTPNPALSFVLNESFRTRNQFNGIDVGWFHTRSIDYWNFDIGLRLAAGNTNQQVRIAGDTVVNGTAPAVSGGLLALNSNIGTYERDEFSIIPELNLKLGYQLTDQLKATFGYTFLYWSNVVRPGDQIERIVDQDQIPNSNAPTPTDRVFPRFAFDNTDYWAQGLSFGLDYRW